MTDSFFLNFFLGKVGGIEITKMQNIVILLTASPSLHTEQQLYDFDNRDLERVLYPLSTFIN